MNDNRWVTDQEGGAMKGRNRVVALLLGGFVLVAAGCLAVGENFSSQPVRKIEKGITTKEEVRKLFGEPFRTGLDDGYESWTYAYNRWSLFSATRSKDLYIVFNRDGTVRTYTYNSNLEED